MLAIITVIYKNYDILTDFFDTLSLQTVQQFHLYVVDLSENPQTYDVPPVLIHNTTRLQSVNKGYAHGVNVGIQQALLDGHVQFCIANPDVLFTATFVNAVQHSIMEHPATIIGGKIVYAPGYEYHQDSPRGKTLWYAGGSIDWAHVLVQHHGVDQQDDPTQIVATETSYVSGCCMCYDHTVYRRIGTWDESYFMYFEDADFCVRAYRAGIPLIYDPRIMLYHKNSQSTGGAGSAFHVKWMTKNKLRFGLRYAPLRTKMHLIKNAFLSFILRF